MITKIIKKSTLPLFLLISSLEAGQGTFITEPFSCKVALANYHHLTKTTKENNPTFVQEQLELSLKLTIEELAEHTECEVK
jgi:hypothetical protein